MRDRTELFAALAGSRFRRGFALGANDLAYIGSRRMERVAAHAREFVVQRLAPAEPVNDGRQTPMRGHPVFVAQHATATCCRGCLAKWHRIAKGRELTDSEIDYVLDVICEWLRRQAPAAGVPDVERGEPLLF